MDPAPQPLAEMGPAGLFRRLAAVFYDGLLLTAVLFLATVPVLFITGGEAVPTGDLLFRTYIFLVCYGYFAFSWRRGGQTPGMKTWWIRVERADRRPLTLPDTMMRFAVALVSTACLGLGFLWALVDREGRTWHDRAAGTRVVRLAKPPRRRP